MNDSTNESTLSVEGFTPYAQVPRWILRAGKGLSHGAVRLYGVIMTYADNDSRTAFPGRDKLAEDLGVKARSITNYIQELESYGALKVLRRRNKRTGNYYANQYTLVFDKPDAKDCTRQSAENCSIPKPTTLTTSTGSTSDQRSEAHVAPSISRNASRDDDSRAKAEQADPISPAFYHSEDRQILLNNIQEIARIQTEYGVQGPEIGDSVDLFQQNLITAFGGSDHVDEDMIDGMLYDMNWIPKRTHVERFKAAIWLNQFINELRDLNVGLSWRKEL